MKLSSFRRKNLQMVAIVMATATYAAGFNPPSGVWQQDTAGHLPGDPIMWSTHHHRYLLFFYFNAAAFALSLMVVVVTLILGACPKKIASRFDLQLLLLMLMAMVAFLVAYGMGACRDKFGVVVFTVASVLVAMTLPTFVIVLCANSEVEDDDKYRAKLIAPLSMFALALAYVGGLNTPGGFWGSDEGGHRPGDTILHGRILHVFYYCNASQFASSLQGILLVTCSGQFVCLAALYLMNGITGLIVVYTIGSSRGRGANIGVICSMCAAVFVYAMIHVAVRGRFSPLFKQLRGRLSSFLMKLVRHFWKDEAAAGSREGQDDVIAQRQGDRAASLVQLLAGLAVSITYQAGMYPPGGVWQDGDKAGDPILQTTNPGRYRAFYYCNSVAFVASLLAILLGLTGYLTKNNALQAAMILDLLALIVAYAIGSCRDQISSMYVLGIAGAVVVYVVVHVQYFTLGSSADKDDKDEAIRARVEKKGGRFLLFAILVASITYQAGLTPPGGFLLQDDGIQSGAHHRVGDPVLLYNYPRRYKAFFYCNSVSFMVSTVLLLLLVNPNMYRPAIQSHALSLCSAVSFLCLIGAFAAGSTQHRKTSFNFIVLAAVAFFLCLTLLLAILYFYFRRVDRDDASQQHMKEYRPKGTRARNKIYLMTLGILMGSVTYQAGLDPPGGSWQSSTHAGYPVMNDMRRNRYLAFLCGNSIAFVASIYLIEILLFTVAWHKVLSEKMGLPEFHGVEKAIEPMVVAQYLGFLVAYAAGASRQWKASAHVGTLVIAVLSYVAIHLLLTFSIKKSKQSGDSTQQQAQA